MNCWIERTPHYTIRLLWTSERSNVLLKLPTACFVHWLTVVRRWQRGQWRSFRSSSNKIKTTNRYFNYIYVRMGVHTFINKRTGNDIWRNLFELPLIETPVAVSEEEFFGTARIQGIVCPQGTSGSPFGLPGRETRAFPPGDLCQFLYS